MQGCNHPLHMPQFFCIQIQITILVYNIRLHTTEHGNTADLPWKDLVIMKMPQVGRIRLRRPVIRQGKKPDASFLGGLCKLIDGGIGMGGCNGMTVQISLNVHG